VTATDDHPYLAAYDTDTLGEVAEWAVGELRDPTPACHADPITLETIRVGARDVLHERALPEHVERVLGSPLTEVFVLAARAVKAGYVVTRAGYDTPSAPRVVTAVARRLNEIDITYADGVTVTYSHVTPLDVRAPQWTWTP
jgi:hypothetical protein